MYTVHIVFQSWCVFYIDNVFAVEDIMHLMPLLEMTRTRRPEPAPDNKSSFMSWKIRTQPRNKNRQKQMKKQRLKYQLTTDGRRQMQCTQLPKRLKIPKKIHRVSDWCHFWGNYLTSHHKKIENRATRAFWVVLDFHFGHWKCPNREWGKGHLVGEPLISGKYGLRNHFWPLESVFLMRKSDKKGPNSKFPRCLIFKFFWWLVR